MKANSFMYSGYRVFELRPVPKLQVNQAFEWITNEGRERVNEWLKTTFGCAPNPAVSEGQAVVDESSRAIYVHGKEYQMLLEAAREPST